MLTQTWVIEPDCPQASGGFTVVGELPTMIGGQKYGHATNELVSLVDGLWLQTFPSMPTPRIYSSAVMCCNHLIVAGGSLSVKLPGDVLSAVEVMDMNNYQSDQAWSVVSSLQHPLAEASMVIHHKEIILLGGTDRNGKTLVTLVCDAAMLFGSKRAPPRNPKNAKSFGTKLKKALDPTSKPRDNTPSLWARLVDSRHFHSTCVSVGG